MKGKYNKLYRVYIFDKDFKVRNAGGFPPSYMFWGKNPIGIIKDIYGTSEEDVLEYVYSVLPEDIKENYDVLVDFLEEINDEKNFN